MFVLYLADHLLVRLICHSRARSVALWCVTLWERVVIGRLRVLEWQNGEDFPSAAVADKQCTGLQNLQMQGQYLPAAPFFRYKNAAVDR